MTAPDPGPVPPLFDEDVTVDGILGEPPLPADPASGDDEFPETIRAKWLMDGAKDLAECARMLEDEAHRLRALHEQGWRLAEPVTDDYGFLAPPRA